MRRVRSVVSGLLLDCFGAVTRLVGFGVGGGTHDTTTMALVEPNEATSQFQCLRGFACKTKKLVSV